MSNEKQTSIEWFAERIQSDKIFNFEKVLQQAKEMYRKELELAYEDGKEIRHILNTIEKNQF